MSHQIGLPILGKWEWRHEPETQTTVYNDAELLLNSFWGGPNRGRCLQVTIREEGGQTAYIQLKRQEVAKVMYALKQWLEENN